MTRSFGDMYMKTDEFNRDPLFSRFRIPEPFNPPLLTAEPNVSVRLLSPHDSFVIVASDGLFDLLSNQEAVDIVASSPKKVKNQLCSFLHSAPQSCIFSVPAQLWKIYFVSWFFVILFFGRMLPGS